VVSGGDEAAFRRHRIAEASDAPPAKDTRRRVEAISVPTEPFGICEDRRLAFAFDSRAGFESLAGPRPAESAAGGASFAGPTPTRLPK